MTEKAKVFSLSLLLHIGIVFGIMFSGRYPASEPPLLVIDFSMAASAAEPERTSAPEELPAPANNPPAQVETLVEKQYKQGKLFKKPQDIPERIIPKAKSARVKIKKHLQPTVKRKEEIPHLPVIARQEPQSSAFAVEKITNNEGEESSSYNGAWSQGPKSAETKPQTESGRNKDYDFTFVRNLIEKNLSFPASARRMGLTGKIVVAFFLKEDGEVAEIAVVESSGHDILDNNVVATIHRISPLPMPPAAARIILPITFRL